MTNKIKAYDRVYLNVPGKDLVLELLDGLDSNEDYVDAWRVIDLATGEEFSRGPCLHTVISTASQMTCEASSQTVHDNYIEGREPDREYFFFKDIPLTVRLQYITSHALDLEHDFRVIKDSRDPVEVATREMNEMYNEKPCFFLNRQTGKWELDMDMAY